MTTPEASALAAFFQERGEFLTKRAWDKHNDFSSDAHGLRGLTADAAACLTVAATLRASQPQSAGYAGGRAEQIADTPGAGLLSEDEALRQLGLLYNYAENDGHQFTRWNMLVAMAHGFGLASEKAISVSDPGAGERVCDLCPRTVEAAANLIERLFTGPTAYVGLELADRIRALKPDASDGSAK